MSQNDFMAQYGSGGDDDSSEGTGAKMASIHSLLKGLVKHKASDLHVKVGRPPLYRINGKLLPAKLPPLSGEDVKKLAYSTMTQKQVKEFEENLQIDFGYLVPGLARFRANVFMQKGTLAFVIRVVPLEVPVLSSLSLPSVVAELCLKPRGLLLVTGATGSGKSTTLAAMVEHINRNARSHIVTIEDPIEYIYEDKMSTVSQREVGVDAMSMQLALRAALRQDPDVIMVGEMRDFNTIQTAITAAETGHLVVSTLHTNTAAQALDRILDSFPADAKNQLRLQLANSLLGVITQRLVRRADGNGRVVACEILSKSPTVEKCILDNRINDLDAVLESSNLYYKMQSMNQALEKMIRDGVISQEEGLANSDKKEDLTLKLSGMVGGGGGVDAGELINQAKESTKFINRGAAPDSKLEQGSGNTQIIDVNGNPDSSGLKVENGPQTQRRQGGPSKGFASMFKKKGA
ncbi:MAG TPA: PilT/PilU family type 4a pilus ATPase [Bdellovibrionota bacterium]|jgi:twitching motility protein PilT